MSDEQAPGLRPKQRAARRANRRRAVARALRVATLFAIPSGDAEMWARQNADHLKVCSCSMCGNVRKWWGPPVREIRWNTTDDDDDRS